MIINVTKKTKEEKKVCHNNTGSTKLYVNEKNKTFTYTHIFINGDGGVNCNLLRLI